MPRGEQLGDQDQETRHARGTRSMALFKGANRTDRLLEGFIRRSAFGRDQRGHLQTDGVLVP